MGSGDRDKDAFTSYHSEMPFAALSFEKKKINSAINDKFECRGIPMLVFLNAKTGKLITNKGRSVVTKHGSKFASEAFELVEKKEKLSVFEDAVVGKDGSNKMQDLLNADVIEI